jgi:hypothetical protein
MNEVRQLVQDMDEKFSKEIEILVRKTPRNLEKLSKSN